MANPPNKWLMKRLVFLIALSVLGGCKSLSGMGLGPASDEIVPVPLSDTRILFDAPAFADRPVVRAKFTDNWQREEYALFRGAESQAEVVYLVATARETSLDYSAGLKSVTEGWNYLSGAEIRWGDEFKAASPFGPVYVLPFIQGSKSCFGFSSEWAIAADDPGVNPTKAAFGYYCQGGNKGLTQAQIKSLVDSVQISPFAANSTSSIAPQGPVSADGGSTGNPNFPFLLARGYTSQGPSLVDRDY